MATSTTRQCASQSNNTRTRSFGGCATCRSRHVKCDEEQPTCSTCLCFGLECGGYQKSIFFDFETTDKTSNTRFRRPLFTLAERKRMSDLLVQTVPPSSALRLLSQLDQECEEVNSSHDFPAYPGPFGVFRLQQDDFSPPCHPPSEESDETLVPEDRRSPVIVPLSDEIWYTEAPSDMILGQFGHGDVPSDADLSPWTQQLVHSILDQPEQIPVSQSPDFLSMPMDSSQTVFDDVPLPELQDFSLPLSVAQHYQSPQYLPASSIYRSLSPAFNASLTRGNNGVPQDALPLLNHYATTVINFMTPFRHTKTPWHVLFLPHAKISFAALTMGETLDQASLSAFFGILAISAFSLSATSRARMWLERGNIYKQLALKQARLMLKTAYGIPKTAKYKSILMALITMVQVSLFSGSRAQTEVYLLEAEKFIRLKGLNRRKSRKVRLLHHCYAFERIFHESMFLCGVNSRQRNHVRAAVESSGFVVRGSDSPSFRMFDWRNLSKEMMVVKDQEEGENDLHIERPGIFSATMYPEIYGIPEEWLFLLSQIIRLGNEKYAAEEQDSTSSLSLKDFCRRAQDIERYINQLQRPSDNATTSRNVDKQIDLQVHDNMLRAIQLALSIYFYRRIYDVDASILQNKVVGVRDCLLWCERADSTVEYGSSGFIWPAVIAACEAEDVELQHSFSNWFRNSAQRCGRSSLADTLNRIEQIWQQKRSDADSNISWL